MAAGVLLAVTFSGVVFLFARRKFQEDDMEKSFFIEAAAIIFLAAFSLRLFLGYTSEGFTLDIDTFKAWARITNEVGFGRIYREDIFLDYPPGYLYVLTLLEKLRLAMGIPAASPLFTLMLKLPSIFADLACAGVLLWAAKRKLGEKNALFIAGAYLFCPAVFINSAQWGQADSFCTAFLLVSVLLLYREKYIPSAIIYGVAIACKPQMLVFAPLYIFFAIRQKKFWSLLLGIFCAFAAILLIATPFTKNFDYMWLFKKYKSTMDYYNYYSVNAYNFWSLIRMNWNTLPDGVMGSLLNSVGPIIATLLCGFLMFFSKRKDALFACPFVLMSAMYIFSVKMHERYLFPALLFLLLSYIFLKDKRILYAFTAVSAVHYLNVYYVLYLFREKAGQYDPNTGITIFFSSLQILAFIYLMYVTYSCYIRGTIKEPLLPVERPAVPLPIIQAKFLRADYIAIAAITIIYAVFAFSNLGLHETAVTPWTPAEKESVVLVADSSCSELYYLPGIVPDSNHYTSRVGVKLKVETSTDGKIWKNCGELEDGSVFAWKIYKLKTPGKYLRLTAQDGNVAVNEVALKKVQKTEFAKLTAENASASTLIDEQKTVPLYINYQNSTYFDEIYHARTAYENIMNLEPYESTHPTLGKLIISAGIRIFGMNPFGWRFMGALFGVLMLPVLYHILKQLFGKTLLCSIGTILFAFDFMHFTQTRIATIDTYAVFFLLLMYDAMVVFLRRDIVRDGMKKLLPPLLLSGIFTGLGIASKWTAAYGALGLAVLFFGKLVMTWISEKKKDGDLDALLTKYGKLCLWCCLFFLLIPATIYFVAFLPITTLPHNAENPWKAFVNYQTSMFDYHSQLKAEHYFASSWYEWPLDIRPIWYFSSNACNAAGQYSTISSMGNPLLWWSFIPAFFAAAWLWIKEKHMASAIAITGFLSVYLPWLLVPRLTFIYHYFTAVPFLIIALIFTVQRLMNTAPLRKKFVFGNSEKSISFSLGALLLCAFTAVNLLLFAVYFPVISGAPTSKAYTDLLKVLPTWYF